MTSKISYQKYGHNGAFEIVNRGQNFRFSGSGPFGGISPKKSTGRLSFLIRARWTEVKKG